MKLSLNNRMRPKLLRKVVLSLEKRFQGKPIKLAMIVKISPEILEVYLLKNLRKSETAWMGQKKVTSLRKLRQNLIA